MSRRVSDPDRRLEFKQHLARHFRINATEVERRLWALLRGRQPRKVRFRRQQPIGPYIVDFFCPATKLIVELDGEQRGYCVFRFGDWEYLKDRHAVIDRIFRVVEGRLPLPEPPMAVRPSLKGRVK